ncbi:MULTISPECIES: ATPase domain-containing protein [unclassified Methanoregula]|uniref:RAD55 family ATPase n=1 Tax=unclassified Methanoregula TaxID=2649730 RepID=UPI0025D823CE|nr:MULTISPECIES: ATPase domain-containing protein [unclassified Methanoregula]
MPTGISSLDPILDGGVPPGSVILLLGDLGAGNAEFVFSSMVNSLDASAAGEQKGNRGPKEIWYVTITRVKEDIRNEILQSFHLDNIERLVDTIRFEDLSEQYFDHSVVPDEWYSHSDVFTRLQKRTGQESMVTRLSKVIDSVQPGSLIVIDSVTDLATQLSQQDAWSNLSGFLRGLQRVSKTRGITSYLLLSSGILDSSRERELADIADAVLLFRWEETQGARRQRVMYFEKFRGVMPHLEERDLVKFAVRISETSGFEVSNIRVII